MGPKNKLKRKKPSKKQRTIQMEVPSSIRADVQRLIDEERAAEEGEAIKPLDRKKYALDKDLIAQTQKQIKVLAKLTKKLNKAGDKLNDIDQSLSRKDERWVDDQFETLSALRDEIESVNIDYF
jgi:small-conductance mechanosensitive channel